MAQREREVWLPRGEGAIKKTRVCEVVVRAVTKHIDNRSVSKYFEEIVYTGLPHQSTG